MTDTTKPACPRDRPRGATEPDAYDPQPSKPSGRRAGPSAAPTSPTSTAPQRPFYNLMMFPYPSAEGLHVGNMFAFTGATSTDGSSGCRATTSSSRSGFDAFGIHSENFALKIGHQSRRADSAEHRELPAPAAAHRRDVRLAARAVAPPIRTTTSGPSGSSCSSSRRAWPTRRRRAVNWCPNCKTVLANEQVIDGGCERCGTRGRAAVAGAVVLPDHRLRRAAARQSRRLDRLVGHAPTTAQRNWIGRSRRRRDRLRVDGAAASEIDPVSSPPGRTRSSARRSWCSRRSTRWSTR